MQMTLGTWLPAVFLLGKVLSVLAILLTGAAIWNAWRRPSFPEVSYGGVRLSNKRLRWVWILVLLGAFGFGVNEEPIVKSTHSLDDPEAAEASTVETNVGLTLPLPFYRYERETVYGDDVLISEYTMEGVTIPWSLISALIAYWVLVLRWNAASRWARRILQGRRWRAEGEP